MDLRTQVVFRGRERSGPVQHIVLHYTAGENPHTTVINTLKARKLSIHFIIDREGVVWKMMSLDEVAQHAGRTVNETSIGIEIVSAGTGPVKDKRRPRETYTEILPGRGRVLYQRFYPEQVQAARELCEDLCKTYQIPFQFPLDGNVPTRRLLSKEELKAHKGLLGHLHISKKKRDPATHLMDDLAGVK